MVFLSCDSGFSLNLISDLEANQEREGKCEKDDHPADSNQEISAHPESLISHTPCMSSVGESQNVLDLEPLFPELV